MTIPDAHSAARLRRFMAHIQPSDWAAIVLLLFYVIIFSTLTIRQHQSFNTNALDLAKFDQSIWNTSRGHPYAITISEDTVNDSHFSPALAIFAPLYWVWSDIRLLLITQSILLSGAGFLIYQHFRRTASWLGLAVFAAYLMHPALHQINLALFRRETLAVFATSYAIYHLLRRQYGWMALGLGLALLSKEDMSLVLVVFGLYLVFVQRRPAIGALVISIGVAWFILIPFVVLPMLMSNELVVGYQHATANYSYLGTSFQEIVQTLADRPELLWEYIGQPRRLEAVFKFLWPTAFMFLLAPEIALMMLPFFIYLLASTSGAVGRLEAWYPSLLIILLYWAVGVGLGRLAGRWRQAGILLLLLAGFSSWIAYSQLWPGRQFVRERYQITSLERQISERLAMIPQEAVVMAQDPLVPHLSHRQNIYLFPWVGDNRPDYVILDRDMRTYPLGEDEYRTAFYDYLASPEYAIADQLGGLYIFQYDPILEPVNSTDEIWDNSMRLLGYDVALAVQNEPYGQIPTIVPAGSNLRISLYWQVQQAMESNYTVFVHAVTPDDRTLAQHDGWPADAHRPTSVLPSGTTFRDVHYLTLNEDIAAADLALRLGLYASDPAIPIPTQSGAGFVLLPMFPDR